MFLGASFLNSSKALRLPSSILKSNMPEVAFIGASNAGKSSLINALFDNVQLARTSRKPGHTKSLNFYQLDSNIVLVDMPGYGKKSHEDWGEMALQYLETRRSLRRVFLLRDIRRDFTSKDRQIMKIMENFGVSYQVLMTKSDLFPPEFQEFRDTVVQKATKYLDRNYPNCVPEILVCSAKTNYGISNLMQEITKLCSK